MGSEKQTWRNLKKVLDRTKVHYQRFEDALSVGIPDLMICKDSVLFVELKQLDTFPVRPGTPVRVGYRRNQWLWAQKHNAAGGQCVLLVQVGQSYYIFDSPREVCEEKLVKNQFICAASAIFNDAEGAAHYLIGRCTCGQSNEQQS